MIYHPDALVFSDQLEYWCGQDFDYIGAPWVVHKDAPYAGQSAHEGKVGNGGFALIKIESFLKVFYSTVYQVEPSQYWGLSHREKSIFERFWHLPKRFLKQGCLKLPNKKSMSARPFWESTPLSMPTFPATVLKTMCLAMTGCSVLKGIQPLSSFMPMSGSKG